MQEYFNQAKDAPAGVTRPKLVTMIQLAEGRAMLVAAVLLFSILPLLLFTSLLTTHWIINLALTGGCFVAIRKIANGMVPPLLAKVLKVPPVVGGEHGPLAWAQTLYDKPADDLYPLQGCLAVVTGGNRGMGYETAKNLASLGCGVIIASRSSCQKEIEQMKKEIKKDYDAVVAKVVADEKTRKTASQGKTAHSDPRIQWVQLDLADTASIESFSRRAGPAAAMMAQGHGSASNFAIDFLINNAGGMPNMFTSEPKTASGHDRVIASNHLGPMMLTESLSTNLTMGGPLPGTTGRVVMLGSATHNLTEFVPSSQPGEAVRDCLKQSSSPDAKGAGTNYFLAKTCNLLYSEHLAKGKFADVTCVHPGWVQTRLGNISDVPAYVKVAGKIFAKTVPAGARTAVYAALAPYDSTTRRSVHHGKFIADCRDASTFRLQFTRRDDEIRNMMAWSRSILSP